MKLDWGEKEDGTLEAESGYDKYIITGGANEYSKVCVSWTGGFSHVGMDSSSLDIARNDCNRDAERWSKPIREPKSIYANLIMVCPMVFIPMFICLPLHGALLIMFLLNAILFILDHRYLKKQGLPFYDLKKGFILPPMALLERDKRLKLFRTRSLYWSIIFAWSIPAAIIIETMKRPN